MFGWFKKKKSGAHKSAAPPLFASGDSDPFDRTLMSDDDLRLALERPCAPVIFSKPANIDPFSTMFGAVRLSRPEEVWPTCKGAPMWPLCQLNLTQAPFVPDALRDLALVTLFIRDGDARSPTEIIDTADPDPAASWALRSYASLDALTIPKAPAHKSPLSPRLGEWGAQTPDYANHDMAGDIVDLSTVDLYAYDWCRSVSQSKLGGWPATVQSEPWWDDQRTGEIWDYVFQIDCEPNAGWHGWGDGAAFIARSRQRPHLWAMNVQFT